MGADSDILYEVRDRIATITLNRPERLNAFTAQMGTALKQAMADADGDRGVRAIVLTGAGRGFCAGADMELLADHARAGGSAPAASQRAEEPRIESPLGPPLAPHFRDAGRFGYFVRSRKPVIAAVNGPAAGLGFVIMLYADLRFAGDAAIFTTAFAQRGLIAEHGISWLLPRLVGQSNALDLLFSARRISAAEAARMQLVNQVFPQDRFLEQVLSYVRILTDTVSPRSLAIMKAQVWKANFQDFEEALAVADEEMRASLAHSEFREGVAHFLEKRVPRFADI